MTRLQTYSRNEQAREVIRSVLLQELTSPPPVVAEVTATDNHAGEPSLYVYVEMPRESDIPEIPTRNALVVKLMAKLAEVDDHRFPYLAFGPREGDSRPPPTRQLEQN